MSRLLDSYRCAARDGDDAAFALLVTRFDRQTRALSRLFYETRVVDRDDYRQAALIGLWRAVKTYQDDQGQDFEVFAWWCMRRQVVSTLRSSIRAGERTLNHAQSLSRQVADSETDDRMLEEIVPLEPVGPLDALIERAGMAEVLRRLEQRLSRAEMQVVLARADGAAYWAIASWLDVGVKSVENALQRARRKLGVEAGSRPPQATLADVVHLYEQGYSARQIAENCGLSETGIYKVLREANISRRRRGTRPRVVHLEHAA